MVLLQTSCSDDCVRDLDTAQARALSRPHEMTGSIFSTASLFVAPAFCSGCGTWGWSRKEKTFFSTIFFLLFLFFFICFPNIPLHSPATVELLVVSSLFLWPFPPSPIPCLEPVTERWIIAPSFESRVVLVFFREYRSGALCCLAQYWIEHGCVRVCLAQLGWKCLRVF